MITGLLIINKSWAQPHPKFKLSSKYKYLKVIGMKKDIVANTREKSSKHHEVFLPSSLALNETVFCVIDNTDPKIDNVNEKPDLPTSQSHKPGRF